MFGLADVSCCWMGKAVVLRNSGHLFSSQAPCMRGPRCQDPPGPWCGSTFVIPKTVSATALARASSLAIHSNAACTSIARVHSVNRILKGTRNDTGWLGLLPCMVLSSWADSIWQHRESYRVCYFEESS